ncbi:MAG: alpha-E domain-containing protein [Acidobacteriota bacterium]
MISRVAESCFWMQRYLARMESTAHLLSTTHAFAMDSGIPPLLAWPPLVVVSGELEGFTERLGEEALGDAEKVEQDMTWSEDNAASIVTCVRWARENARQTRETISREMWDQLNSFWVWMRSADGRRIFDDDRTDFYRRCEQTAQLLRGASEDTLLHEEAYDFMRLGLFLERAGQTLRVLDVKYHALGPTRSGDRESAIEFAQWAEILRCCCASESFFKRRFSLTGPRVAGFLLFDRAFPRSAAFCLERASSVLERIAGDRPVLSAQKLENLNRELGDGDISGWIRDGLHDRLTDLIGLSAEVCDAVHADFFAAHDFREVFGVHSLEE